MKYQNMNFYSTTCLIRLTQYHLLMRTIFPQTPGQLPVLGKLYFSPEMHMDRLKRSFFPMAIWVLNENTARGYKTLHPSAPPLQNKQPYPIKPTHIFIPLLIIICKHLIYPKTNLKTFTEKVGSSQCRNTNTSLNSDQ